MWPCNLSPTTIPVTEHRGQEKTQQKLNRTSTTTTKESTILYLFCLLIERGNIFLWTSILLRLHSLEKEIFTFYFSIFYFLHFSRNSSFLASLSKLICERNYQKTKIYFPSALRYNFVPDLTYKSLLYICHTFLVLTYACWIDTGIYSSSVLSDNSHLW